MDAFVVRTKRDNICVKKSPKKKFTGRQRRLSDLQGVVVLEDLEKSVKKLKDPKVEDEEKLRILKALRKKQPSTEIIKSTGVGKILNKLIQNSSSSTNTISAEVVEAAQVLKNHWKRLIERRVELSLGDKPEVATDLETQTIREKARALFFKTYREESEIKIETLQSLERKFYRHFKPCIGVSYRKAIRRVAANPSAYLDFLKAENLDEIVSKVVAKK